MGRPEKLDEGMKANIVKCIKLGLSYKYTCYYVGINETSFIDWRHRGEFEKNEGTDSIYSKLFTEVKKAEAEAIAMRLKNIHNASQESWQAAAWFLERKYHQEFGKKDRSERFIEGMSLREFMAMLPDDTVEEIKKMIFKHKTEKKGEKV